MVAIVLVEVNMYDRNLRVEQIDEFEEIIPGCSAQIGMSYVQAHAHSGHGIRGKVEAWRKKR